jgi:hypothetical protein
LPFLLPYEISWGQKHGAFVLFYWPFIKQQPPSPIIISAKTEGTLENILLLLRCLMAKNEVKISSMKKTGINNKTISNQK